MTEHKALRLVAEDEADLQVLSAAVQDSVTTLGDISFDRKSRRFVLALNRFRWEAKATAEARGGKGERARTALSIEGVTEARTRGLAMADKETIVSLLSMTFTADAEPPGGKLSLIFAGDGEIALDIECVDVMLTDLGPVWSTRNEPDHKT